MSKLRATTLHELQRERQMMSDGHDRFMKRQSETKDLTLDKAHFQLLEAALPKVTKAIQERLAAAAQPCSHRPYSWLPDVQNIDPELLAYLALVVCMKSVGDSQTRTSCLRLIGARIEMENFSLELQNHDKKLHKELTDTVRHTYSNVDLRNKAVIDAARRKGFGVTLWDEERKIKAAAPILSSVLEASGIFEVWTRHSDGKTRYLMGITEEASYLIANINYDISWNNPVCSPMVTEPLAWTCDNLTPYLDPAMTVITPLIRHASGKQKRMMYKSIRTGRMQPALDALNAIQRTKYTINRYALEAAKWAWENNKSAGDTFPSQVKIDLPKPPEKTAEPKKFMEWRSAMQQATLINREVDASRSLISTDFKTAEELDNYEHFFLPQSFDSRGRIYPISHFSTHRADYVKSLFLLADQKKIGERGAYWIAVQVANTGDFNKLSKESFDDRIAWVMDNAERIAAIGNDFEGTHSGNEPSEIYWSDADKPFAFLAACREFYGFWVEGTNYKSGLPINLDGSNSGIQHYSAASLTESDGALVNLIPSDKPQDIYQTVADQVIKYLEQHIEEHASHQEWLDFGITRKIVKRNVMTYGYSSKTFGFSEQLMEDLMEGLTKDVKIGRLVKHPFSNPQAAANALAKVNWTVINHVIVGASNGMRYWQALATAAAKDNRTMSWFTPMGFPVDNSYYKNKSKRLRIYMYDKETDSQIASTMRLNKDDITAIDIRKCAAAISPNMIHSLDSSHLMDTVLRSLQVNVKSFVLIHDSFGTLPADTDKLFKTIRESFIALYQNRCVYSEMSKQQLIKNDDLPDIPEKGNLVLKDIIKSDYCFA